MNQDITATLKAAGYATVEIVDRVQPYYVKPKGTDTKGRYEARQALDLHVGPEDKAAGGRWAVLDVLDKAGIRYDRGGVRVTNGVIIVPDLTNNAKGGNATKAA